MYTTFLRLNGTCIISVWVRSVCQKEALFNPVNAELNPICHLLALLGTHHILYIRRVRVNQIQDGECIHKTDPARDRTKFHTQYSTCSYMRCVKFDIHMSVHWNIITNYSQQDAAFLEFINFYRRSTCFRRFLRP
jgi:hypothetical protein